MIISDISKLYPELILERQLCPNYVRMYTKEEFNIILIYKKGSQISANTTSNCEKNHKEELELTGSPLKVDLSLHTVFDDTLISDEPQIWSKEESSHYPIDISLAREVTSLFCNQEAEIPKEESVPIWILCNPSSESNPLLLMIETDEDYFKRGIVIYEGMKTLSDINEEELLKNYIAQQEIAENMVDAQTDCNYVLSGVSYNSHSCEELLNAPHTGISELHCSWAGNSLRTPFISCNVTFNQEVIIGHPLSPCNVLWKSVCALHYINQHLVEMTVAGQAYDLQKVIIKEYTSSTLRPDNYKRLKDLLNETEMYACTAECPTGGCICITEDTNSLKQCLGAMQELGSSNDFTYRLWDVLRDCETAEELVTLLIQALKFISSAKIRPFIDANNNTYLSKLVLKLSRGHSQTGKVLKNLRSSPPQALSLVGQVGIEKTMWEYTKIMSLLEHSFFIAGIWNADNRIQESIDQINQTIQDMTMGGGDFTLNPFESLTPDHSIRLNCESYQEDAHELTVDDFASLKSQGLVNDRKDTNEIPIIADEIDIRPWKNILTKFAQVHACLEHLHRAECSLRADFASLKPITSRLLESYVSERSPIKSVGQLLSDPLLKISMPIANSIVQDHLKKPAFWYRMEFQNKCQELERKLQREIKMVYVFSQQPVFPPSVWQNLDPNIEGIAETTTIDEELKYFCSKFTYITNKMKRKIILN